MRKKFSFGPNQQFTTEIYSIYHCRGLKKTHLKSRKQRMLSIFFSKNDSKQLIHFQNCWQSLICRSRHRCCVSMACTGLYQVHSGTLACSEGLVEFTIRTCYCDSGIVGVCVYICLETGLPGLPWHEWRGYNEVDLNNTGML